MTSFASLQIRRIWRKRPLEGGEVDLPEVGNRVVVGVVASGEDAEGHILVDRLLYLSSPGCNYAVGVEEELHHHRMLGRPALQMGAVSLLYLRHVKLSTM